jgi:hypothetical protein
MWKKPFPGVVDLQDMATVCYAETATCIVLAVTRCVI